MQSVSARIWTRVAVFIFYDDNHYTTGTSYPSLTFAKMIQNTSINPNNSFLCSIDISS